MRPGLVLLSLFVLTAGCLSPGDLLGHAGRLEEARKKYTSSVRWGQVEQASHFVDPSQQEVYRSLAKDFEVIQITDSEASDLRFEGDDEAVVDVTYRAYSLATLVERRFQEKQRWYREPGMGSDWRVRTDLAEVLKRMVGERS